MRPRKVFGRNRTKMLHVKRLGKIGKARLASPQRGAKALDLFAGVLKHRG
jgi:hypothetical protein